MAEQRLIDANALIEEYDRVHVGPPGGARKLMEDAPTIEERKNGKWIVRNVEDFKGRPTGQHFIKCDQCGEEEIISFGRRPFDFCPNCGADMRGIKDGCKYIKSKDKI